jgi:hypothetical protein
MDHSDNQSLDIDPTVGRAKNRKFRDIKQQARWRHIGQRRANYEDHTQTCALLGDEPDSKHAHGHISAAKLKGSPEYDAKVAKMSERRNRVRHHEPDILTSNVRWCGCSTDYGAPEHTLCCWCAEYGAPDMKPIPQDAWGSVYANTWTQTAKRRKVRPYDKACAPSSTTPAFEWELAQPANEPHTYNNIIIYLENEFYDIYP